MIISKRAYRDPGDDLLYLSVSITIDAEHSYASGWYRSEELALRVLLRTLSEKASLTELESVVNEIGKIVPQPVDTSDSSVRWIPCDEHPDASLMCKRCGCVISYHSIEYVCPEQLVERIP